SSVSSTGGAGVVDPPGSTSSTFGGVDGADGSGVRPSGVSGGGVVVPVGEAAGFEPCAGESPFTACTTLSATLRLLSSSIDAGSLDITSRRISSAGRVDHARRLSCSVLTPQTTAAPTRRRRKNFPMSFPSRVLGLFARGARTYDRTIPTARRNEPGVENEERLNALHAGAPRLPPPGARVRRERDQPAGPRVGAPGMDPPPRGLGRHGEAGAPGTRVRPRLRWRGRRPSVHPDPRRGA